MTVSGVTSHQTESKQVRTHQKTVCTGYTSCSLDDSLNDKIICFTLNDNYFTSVSAKFGQNPM